MPLAPTWTSSGTRSVPLSLKRPGPTARTSPSWGFSLAVSGMTRPEAVVCSASRDLTTMRSSSGLMETDTVVTFPSGQSETDYGLWGSSRLAAVAGVDLPRGRRWHFQVESANKVKSRYAVSTRSSRVPTLGSSRPPVACEDGGMDAAMVDRLAAGEGWALLQSLPPYDEDTSLHLQGRLREAGFAADLVAAAMTQSRLRARGVDKFGDFAAGMLFTSDGLEQSTRLAIAARHAHRYAAAGVRDVYDLGCGLGADAMAFAGLDLRVHAVDADDTTARIAAVNRRPGPPARVPHGLAEDIPLPQGEGRRHLGLWLDPARR